MNHLSGQVLSCFSEQYGGVHSKGEVEGISDSASSVDGPGQHPQSSLHEVQNERDNLSGGRGERLCHLLMHHGEELMMYLEKVIFRTLVAELEILYTVVKDSFHE